MSYLSFKMYPNYLYIETCHMISHEACQNLYQKKKKKKKKKKIWTHSKNPKSQSLTPPENHVKMFENQKSNATIQTPLQEMTFHQYTSFTKYLYFLRCGLICPSISQIFHPFKFELFDLKNPKKQTSHFPSLHIILNPNRTSKAQKIPIWCSSWPWNRCTHTFGRSASIWTLCCLKVICQVTLFRSLKYWAPQNSATSSNHLKKPIISSPVRPSAFFPIFLVSPTSEATVSACTRPASVCLLGIAGQFWAELL